MNFYHSPLPVGFTFSHCCIFSHSVPGYPAPPSPGPAYPAIGTTVNGTTVEANCISVEPFGIVSWAQGNYRVPGTACVDGGASAYLFFYDYDVTGPASVRVDGFPDLGAYEE